jgi:hypothetical protein
MASKKKTTIEAAPSVPSFDFGATVAPVTVTPKGKKETHPLIPVPAEHVGAMRDYKTAKKLEAEAEALLEGEAIKSLKAYAYNEWLTRGVTKNFASSLKFTSTYGDVLYIGTKSWKKISSEDDANFLREKLGAENFAEMVTKTTTLVGDLATVQTQFNALVQSGKITTEAAKTMFEFITQCFNKNVTYEFKKDVLDWNDVFALAGGDKELADKVINTTLVKKPYFREA